MNTFKRFLNLFLCAMMLFFTGCWKKEAAETQSPNAELQESLDYIELSQLAQYRLIRSENADIDTISAASKLLNLLKEQGVNVVFTTDYVRSGEEIPTSAQELVFGVTNRGETRNLRYSDFAIVYDNGRIFIDGGSVEALENASKWLCSSCISDGKLWLNKLPYMYSAAYSLDNLKIFGVALKEFTVEQSEGNADDELIDWLGARVGMRSQSENGYIIRVIADKSLDFNEISVALVGKELQLCASAHLGDLSVVVDYFLNAIEMRGGNDLSFPGKIQIEMPESTVSLKDVRAVSASTKFIYAETDKDPLTYEIGDEVVFACTLYADSDVVSCPAFSWTANTGENQVYTGESSGSTGKILVRIPAMGAGNIRLKVLVKDEYGTSISEVSQANFSVVVNAKSITTSKAEPADFDAFWAAQVAKVNAVSPDVLSMEKVTSPHSIQCLDGATVSTASHDFYRVKIQTPSECGYAVGYLTIPKNETHLGITVVFNGYGVGDLAPYISPSHIVLNVCSHSFELGQSSSYYNSFFGGSLANFGFNNNDNRDTVYFRTMIMRDLQMVRFVKAYAGSEGVMIGGAKTALNIWNGKLKLYGGSQGAFQGIAVAALDHDVTDAYWMIPWMCDIGGSISEFRPTYTAALGYYDSVFFARRIKNGVNVTFTAGLGDYICPPDGVVALYNNLNTDVTLYFKQGMTHVYTPPKTSVTVYEK